MLKSKKFVLVLVLVVFGLGLMGGGFFMAKNFLSDAISRATTIMAKKLALMAVLAASTSNITIIKPADESASVAEKKSEDTPAQAAPKLNIPAPNSGMAFQWGATMRPAAYGYTAENWQAQIQKAKELGLGWARMNWDYSGGFARNDAFLNPLFDAGMNAVVVIEHNPAKGTGHMYQDGLDDGKTIGGHLNGKVKYFQMGNEGGAQSIKSGTLSGQYKSDYDDGEYNMVKDYLRGLSEGLSASNPGAQKIVNISWMHTGFLDRLATDGVDFDMIGIDWYDWMGNFGARRLASGATLYDKLRSFGKPLTFMEINTCPTSADGSSVKTVIDEEHQANFLTSHATWAWNHRDYVKGFYVLELVDNVNNSNANKEYYGIIRAEMGKLGEPRQAYNALRDLISSH